MVFPFISKCLMFQIIRQTFETLYTKNDMNENVEVLFSHFKQQLKEDFYLEKIVHKLIFIFFLRIH